MGQLYYISRPSWHNMLSPFPTLPLVNQEVILSFETLAMFQERSHQLRNRTIIDQWVSKEDAT